MIPLVYMVVAFVLWPFAAWRMLRSFRLDAVWEQMMLVVLSGCVAAVWPAWLAAFGVWMLVRTGTGGEQR